MTVEVVDDRAERAQEIEEAVIKGTKAIRTAWVALAAYLHEFHFQKMWETRDCDTFKEWLGTPEISLGRSQTYALIEIYRELVLKRGLDPKTLTTEPSKIAQVLPALRRGDIELEAALSDAESLSRADLREKYGKGSTGAGGVKLVECEQCGRQRKADPDPKPPEQIDGQMEIDG
jgi:hypothetical protein